MLQKYQSIDWLDLHWQVKLKIRFRLEEHVDYYTQGIQVNLLIMVCYEILKGRGRRGGREGYKMRNIMLKSEVSLGPVCRLGRVDPLLVPGYLRPQPGLFRAVDGGRLDTFLELNTDRGL